MKHDTFDKYRPEGISLAERALLTSWSCLAAYREDLVLIGGLAVRLLTQRAAEGLPDAVTLDVDFGISIATSNGLYGSIRETLSAHGFEWSKGRFAREFEEMTLFIDLLTDDGESNGGAVVVDDGLSVTIMPGIERALACHRIVDVSGTTLLGVKQTESIHVAEVGPTLVLKLNAFGGRKAPKDAHDIAYLVTNYIDGSAKAVAAFSDEKAAKNRGMPAALQALQNNFMDEGAAGSVSCAAFQLNNQHLLPENAEAAARIRQRCVTIAQALLG
jgi:predicted nucleotidyltransferase